MPAESNTWEFLLDENLPKSLWKALRAAGYPAAPSVPASLLHHRYHIISKIGQGGFGAVYKAEDVQRNDSIVAIKSINLIGLSPQEMIEATDTLNREARLLSGLDHHNLPRIHDHFIDPEHWYLVMDFIEGETLEEYLGHTRDGYLPVKEVLEIGVQLCTVLHYLHTHQPPIIFRDVKPANIMRTPSGQLYLIDFGIARHFTPGQARDTSALGSPGYASKWPIFRRILALPRNAAPEQYSKAQTPVQTDIYSLGATLRYLLTGKDLSESTSSNAAPDVQDQQAPTLLEQFFMQMLEVDADKRPESMNMVKRVLLQIQLAGLLYEREALHAGSLPPRVLPARQAPQRPESAILSFIGKALCSIGIHQGEWTRTGCQLNRYCILCGKPQNRERHNWPPSEWGEYFEDGSCEKRVTCLDCKKTKSVGVEHEDSKHWWGFRSYLAPGSICKRCGGSLDEG